MSANLALTGPGPKDHFSQTLPPLPSLCLVRWGWHCPPDPFTCRRAQLKRCLEQLRQQMPLGVDCTRYTTLSLLRRARMHIQVRCCLAPSILLRSWDEVVWRAWLEL